MSLRSAPAAAWSPPPAFASGTLACGQPSRDARGRITPACRRRRCNQHGTGINIPPNACEASTRLPPTPATAVVPVRNGKEDLAPHPETATGSVATSNVALSACAGRQGRRGAQAAAAPKNNHGAGVFARRSCGAQAAAAQGGAAAAPSQGNACHCIPDWPRRSVLHCPMQQRKRAADIIGRQPRTVEIRSGQCRKVHCAGSAGRGGCAQSRFWTFLGAQGANAHTWQAKTRAAGAPRPQILPISPSPHAVSQNLPPLISHPSIAAGCAATRRRVRREKGRKVKGAQGMRAGGRCLCGGIAAGRNTAKDAGWLAIR